MRTLNNCAPHKRLGNSSGLQLPHALIVQNITPHSNDVCAPSTTAPRTNASSNFHTRWSLITATQTMTPREYDETQRYQRWDSPLTRTQAPPGRGAEVAHAPGRQQSTRTIVRSGRLTRPAWQRARLTAALWHRPEWRAPYALVASAALIYMRTRYWTV